MIYVDEIRNVTPRGPAARFGLKWCHMTASGDLGELHAMAEKIGLARRYFQPHALAPHYDLTPKMRAKALAAGAVFFPARDQARQRAEQREKQEMR